MYATISPFGMTPILRMPLRSSKIHSSIRPSILYNSARTWVSSGSRYRLPWVNKRIKSIVSAFPRVPCDGCRVPCVVTRHSSCVTLSLLPAHRRTSLPALADERQEVVRVVRVARDLVVVQVGAPARPVGGDRQVARLRLQRVSQDQPAPIVVEVVEQLVNEEV